MAKKPKILICDDDTLFHQSIQLAFENKYEVVSVYTGEEALQEIKDKSFSSVLLDIQLRTADEGLKLIPQIKNIDPDLAIIMSSGLTDLISVREALKRGATDYIPKGASQIELDLALDRIIETQRNRQRQKQQSSEVVHHHRRHVLVGQSKPILNLLRTVEKVRESPVNVVITGEPGTGKEVVANLLRGSKEGENLVPFVAVDSATIQSSTAESMLFGHERGAFTGAEKTRKGLFEEADGGIIYFDEIGNMPLDIQAKLLRVIQEKEIVRMGSSKTIPLSFRVICASNRNLEQMVKENLFREDLLSRLSVIPIHLPPLRERKEDVPLLIQHFMNRSEVVTRPIPFTPEAVALLQRYKWPGNVRELGNLVAYVATMTEGSEIDVVDLPPKIRDLENQPDPAAAAAGKETDFYGRVKNFEKQVLTQEFQRMKGNVAQLARELSMDRSHLYLKLKSYGIFTGKNP